MASRSIEVQQQLWRRLRKVVREWPANPSRKGRDLGEFLKERYLHRFQEEYRKDPSKALSSLESLERLNSNYYRNLYPREKEHAFSGDLLVNNPSILSNETLQGFQKSRTRTFWERLTGRGRTLS